MDRTLIWQLAFRYLRGKRSANAVPVLSRISMVAIAVSSAAMIVVFSVFNGMEGVVKDLYKAFYPAVRVTAAKGKFFGVDSAKISAIRAIPGVINVTNVIEDNAIVNNLNSKEQKVISVKGIDRNYFKVNDITEDITGDDSVSSGHPYTAIAGMRILNELGADIHNIFSTIELYYPNPEITNFAAAPESAIQSLRLHPAGAFHISDEFDGKYVLIPLSLAQELLRQPGSCSSIEINTGPEEVENVKTALQHLFGSSFHVETRYEQNKTMFMVIGGEKWAIYAILVLVLLVASFNMVGALSMLVLEKQKDIAILKAMGAQAATIRSIFLFEGILWSLAGGLSGLLLGGLICFMQQKFGLIKMGGSFLMDEYPVAMKPFDFVLVFCTILVVGLLTSWYPAMRATRAIDPSLKSA
jgi:lipoprotein-releasing system permease protein